MARPKQETLTLFPEIVSITRKFSDAQFGALMRAAFAYRFGGETYSGDDPAVDVAFQTVAGQIDRYIAREIPRTQKAASVSKTKRNVAKLNRIPLLSIPCPILILFQRMWRTSRPHASGLFLRRFRWWRPTVRKRAIMWMLSGL